MFLILGPETGRPFSRRFHRLVWAGHKRQNWPTPNHKNPQFCQRGPNERAEARAGTPGNFAIGVNYLKPKTTIHFSPIKCKGLICFFFRRLSIKRFGSLVALAARGVRQTVAKVDSFFHSGGVKTSIPFSRCTHTFLESSQERWELSSITTHSGDQNSGMVSTEFCFFFSVSARWRWCPWKLSTFLTTHQPLPLPHRLHQSHPQTRPTSKGFLHHAFLWHLYHIHSQLKPNHNSPIYDECQTQ